MGHPGEQFYPEGVRWDDPIARGTLPDLLSAAAAEFGARPAIEFRERSISYSELEAMVETAAGAFLRAGYGKNNSVALFLGNSPDHPVNFFGALKAGARVAHLSPLDGEIALSHKLTDSGARVLVTREHHAAPVKRIDLEDLADVTFLVQHFRLTEADLEESFSRLPARFRADPVVQDNLRFIVEDLL